MAEALFTTMSMPPNRSTVWLTAAATDSSSRTSPRIGSAVPPAATISSAAVWIVPGSRASGWSVLAMIATFAPSRAARTAMASPMPRLPPDMIMVLPAREWVTLETYISEPVQVYRQPVLRARQRHPVDRHPVSGLGAEPVALQELVHGGLDLH